MTSTRTLRSVEVFQRAEANSWEKTEAVYADVSNLMEEQGLDSSRPDDVKTGLYKVEDEIHRQLRQANLDIGRNYVHDLYVTRIAWPPEDRVPQASFSAHYLLRSKTYDDKRKARLEKMVAQSTDGQVGKKDVARWISERKPRAHLTFLELFDRRVRGVVKAHGKPWHLLDAGDREQMARLLRVIAGEVQDGSFPKKAK